MHGYYEGFPFMGLGMLIDIVVFILIIVLIIKNINNSEKSAHEILEKRYAKGDITLEEYNEKSKILKKNK